MKDEAAVVADQHDTLFPGEWATRVEFLAIEETDEAPVRFIDPDVPWAHPGENWLVTDDDRNARDSRPLVYVMLPNGFMIR